jgi:hypothetical protein
VVIRRPFAGDPRSRAELTNRGSLVWLRYV